MPVRFVLITIMWLAVLVLLEAYAFGLIRAAMRPMPRETQRVITWAYWGLTVTMIVLLALWITHLRDPAWARGRAVFAALFFANFAFKLVASLVAGMDDLRRGIFWVARFLGQQTGQESLAGLPVTRSQFVAQAGLVLAAVPAVGMAYGVIRGSHQYRVHRVRVPVAGLPPGWAGFTIAQLSDIHSGSFHSRRGVERGVAMTQDLGADMIVFTGDLVNDRAEEIRPFMNVFSRLSAKHGVYSVLGNHDYGDYVSWPSLEAKRANLRQLIAYERDMGWQPLLDEHQLIHRQGARAGTAPMALIGIQNWGARANFPKYGDLARAAVGTSEAGLRVLLSHDPSHWLAQVVPGFGQIELALAGHTHGMQIGIEVPGLKWSPVQYVYEQWAGLYTQGRQHLYVNRGFGYIGYPGRLGIWPEITLLELVPA